jgi:hypothetical protein
LLKKEEMVHEDDRPTFSLVVVVVEQRMVGRLCIGSVPTQTTLDKLTPIKNLYFFFTNTSITPTSKASKANLLQSNTFTFLSFAFRLICVKNDSLRQIYSNQTPLFFYLWYTKPSGPPSWYYELSINSLEPQGSTIACQQTDQDSH